MSQEALIPGMEFAYKHDLTRKEIEILLPFMTKNWFTQDLAVELKVSSNMLHHYIQRLKLKNMLILRDKDENGRYLYEFNQAQLQ